MRTSPIINLKNNLLLDEDYFKYNEMIYKNEHVIDKDLLVKLLNKHFDLYYTFLKINLFIYRFEIKGLNKELKDFKHYKGKNYYIDDLDCILRFYYRNYPRCQSAMRKIIKYKLRPKNELKLLEMILNNPAEQQIRPVFDDEMILDA